MMALADMDEACADVSARARKNHAQILRSLASVGQVNVAKQMDVSEATISRLKDGELAKLATLLAACGLKCVPCTLKCYHAKDIDSLLHFAKQQMAKFESHEHLAFED